MATGAPERIELHSGLPYWLLRNGLNERYPRLDRDLRTRVLVIGGGITGALCAYELAQAGVEVVVIDSRAPGTGSTCASTALLQYEIDTPLLRLIELVGEDHAVRSYRACASAIHHLHELAVELGVGDDFQFVPSVQFASRRGHVKDLRKEAALRKTHGFDVELFEGAHVHRCVPFDAPAVLRSELAAQVDTWRFTQALLARIIGLGASVFAYSEALRIEESAGGVQVRTNGGRTIHADTLIHATGYETQDLLPRGVLELFSTYAIASEAGTSDHPWPFNALIWETAQPYLYLRTAPEGRIIVGGKDTPFRDPQARDLLLSKKAKALAYDFHWLFPDVPFRRQFAWCGTFGATADSLPIVDRQPGMKRAWLALGMGGNGIVFSAIAAEILRDQVLGKVHACAELFLLERFRK